MCIYGLHFSSFKKRKVSIHRQYFAPMKTRNMIQLLSKHEITECFVAVPRQVYVEACAQMQAPRTISNRRDTTDCVFDEYPNDLDLAVEEGELVYEGSSSEIEMTDDAQENNQVDNSFMGIYRERQRRQNEQQEEVNDENKENQASTGPSFMELYRQMKGNSQN